MMGLCKHRWVYAAGVCKCSECGRYLQPNGNVTSTPTGRGGKIIEHIDDDEPEVITELGDGNFLALNNFMTLWEAVRDREHCLDQGEPLTEAAGANEAELRSLAEDLIRGQRKPDQGTYDRLAKAINDNGLLRQWAKGFTAIKLRVSPNSKTVNRKLEAAFVLPSRSLTGDFIGRFVDGKETFNGLLHRNPVIELILAPTVIDRCSSPAEIIDTLRSAITYYDRGLDPLSREVLGEVLRLGPVAKRMIIDGDLLGIVALPLLALLNIESIKPGSKAFEPTAEMHRAVREFVVSIAKLPKLDNHTRQKVISEIRRTCREVTMIPLDRDLRVMFDRLPGALDDLCSGRAKTRIETVAGKWVMAQTESAEVLTEAAKRAKVKRLKKIPSDLVSYIIIEGEAIRDANDKMLIVSYAYGKLDIVEWYIELIDTQSKRYIVPHTRDYLVSVKRDLMAAIKKIMDTPIPKPSDPIVQVTYPPGYEG